MAPTLLLALLAGAPATPGPSQAALSAAVESLFDGLRWFSPRCGNDLHQHVDLRTDARDTMMFALAPHAIGPLVKRLARTRDEFERQKLIRALGTQGPTIKPYLNALARRATTLELIEIAVALNRSGASDEEAFGLVDLLLSEQGWAGLSALGRFERPDPERLQRALFRATLRGLNPTGIGFEAMVDGRVDERWLVALLEGAATTQAKQGQPWADASPLGEALEPDPWWQSERSQPLLTRLFEIRLLTDNPRARQSALSEALWLRHVVSQAAPTLVQVILTANPAEACRGLRALARIDRSRALAYRQRTRECLAHPPKDFEPAEAVDALMALGFEPGDRVLVESAAARYRRACRQKYSLCTQDGVFASAEREFRASAPSPSPESVDEELVVRRLAPDVWLFTQSPFMSSNALAVRMPDGSFVFASSLYETVGTHDMLRWLSEHVGPVGGLAINTHFHFDGTGGNAAYDAAGVTTYASDLTSQLLAEHFLSMRSEGAALFPPGPHRDRVEALELKTARQTFPLNTGLSLRLGGEEVRVLHPGPAHSPDNVVVYFPSRRLLFGGCMVKRGDSLGYLGAADLAHWEASVRVLEDLDPLVVVPGHGVPGGTELLRNTTRLVRAARTSTGP